MGNKVETVEYEFDEELLSEAKAVTDSLRVEHRVVCAGYGTPGHHEHGYTKEGLALCEKYKDKLSDEMRGTKMAEFELPYRIQTRVVSDWTNIVAND